MTSPPQAQPVQQQQPQPDEGGGVLAELALIALAANGAPGAEPKPPIEGRIVEGEEAQDSTGSEPSSPPAGAEGSDAPGATMAPQPLALGC